MNQTKQVLILEDHDGERTHLAKAFSASADYTFVVSEAKSIEQAAEHLSSVVFDVMTIDLSLSASMESGTVQFEGMSFLERMLFSGVCPDAVRLVITAYASPDRVKAVMRSGVWDVIIKKDPTYYDEAVRSAVARLTELQQRRAQESHILGEWLPLNQSVLKRDHHGKYIAISEDRVVASEASLLKLAMAVPFECLSRRPLPFVLRVEG